MKRKNLGKKLVGYSAAAGAALAVGTPAANAGIIFTPANITLEGPFEISPVDLDGDGVGEFYFIFTSDGYSNSVFQFQFPPDYVAGAVIAGSNVPVYNTDSNFAFSTNFVKTIAKGSLIDYDLFSTPGYIIGYTGPYFKSPLGNFIGARGFAGAAFEDADEEVHFAWIDIEASSDLKELTIHG